MKLHFSFIADTLKDEFQISKQVFGPSSDWTQRTSFPRVAQLDQGPVEYRRGDLVIARAEELPDNPHGFEGCSLICLGAAPQGYQTGLCDYLELPENLTLTELLASLGALFDRMESWHERVVDVLVRSGDLADLYNLYLEMIENPVFFTDEAHIIVVYVEDPARVDKPDLYHFLSHDMSDADIRENLLHGVFVSPLYESTFKTSGPQLWSDDDAPNDCLYCNVFSEGTYRGRILVDERVRNFRISDYALVQMLHDDMTAFLSSKSRLASNSELNIWQHLLEVLDGKSPNLEELAKIRHNAGWENIGHFICFVVRLNERDQTIGSGFVNCRLIEKATPGSRALLYSNAIVVIAPLHEGMNPNSFFSQELAIVIRDNYMKVGVSNEFSDLADLKVHYEQALLALETGQLLGKTDWVLHCDDCFLPYMLHHCSGDMNHQALCSTKLQTLINYDSEHNLEYVKTLKGYLENNCSQAEACRALFLHRSTLIQRLKRITEITRFDLDDKDTRLYLLMYFAMQSLRE